MTAQTVIMTAQTVIMTAETVIMTARTVIMTAQQQGSVNPSSALGRRKGDQHSSAP